MLHRIRKNKSFLAAVNQLNTDVKKWRVLGEGSYGRAYDMGDGRVCKITTNEREVKVARRLMKGKKYSYLYKILNVFTIRARKKFKYGLIITPRYKKLTDRQKAELHELFCSLDLGPRFRIGSVKQIRDKIKKAVTDFYFPIFGIGYGAHGIVDYAIKKRLKVFNKFNILYMLRNLKDAKLGPEDMHYDNILRDGDHFVLIDIGC